MDIEILKEKFGFPLSYTPEGMDESMQLSEEQTLALYKKYETADDKSISQIMNDLDRDLDELYDKWLDGEGN